MSYEKTVEEYERETAASKAAYWAGKEEAITLEIECWKFQKIEAEQNANSARIAVEQHEIRLERQKEQNKTIEMIKGL